MDRKISEMTAATSLAGADILPVVQGGANKKITVTNLFGNIKVPVSINQDGTDTDTKIGGQTDANLVFVDASTDRVGIGSATPQAKLDIDGDAIVRGVSSNPSNNTLTSSGVISLTTDTTIIGIASSATATLANGVEGQRKTIVSNNVGPVVLTPANAAGFTNVTFNAEGDSVDLKFVSGKWYIVGSNSATIA